MFKNLFVPAVILLSFTLAVPEILFSQTEEDLDKMISSDNSIVTTKVTSPESKKTNWELYGFLENSNHVSAPGTSALEDYKIIKAEARGQLNVKYSTGIFFSKGTFDLYLYPETAASGDESNSLDTYHQWGRIEAQELYIGFGKNVRFKFGKQLFSWGTADVFNVTNYLDQPDLREFITKDKDDKNRGVLALSIKYLFGDFAIEGVILPIHSPALSPAEFWKFSPAVNGFDTTVHDPEAVDASIKNIAAALRAGGTVGFLDFNLSYFTGYNHDIIYTSGITGSTYAERRIELTPYFDRRHTLGLDLAASIDKLSLRAETAFTFNIPAVYKQDNTALSQIKQYWSIGANQAKDIDTIMTEIAGSGTVFPMGIEKEKYINYLIGADYNLWGNNGLILVEWIQGFYLSNGDSYTDPLFDSILLVRVEDKFLNEQLAAEAGTMIRPVQRKPGAAIFYEVKWDFKNGFSLSQGGYFFIGNDDDLFELVQGKDMLYFSARYSF